MSLKRILAAVLNWLFPAVSTREAAMRLLDKWLDALESLVTMYLNCITAIAIWVHSCRCSVTNAQARVILHMFDTYAVFWKKKNDE